MSLDMLLLGGQVREMARAVAGDASTLGERLRAARELLTAESADWEFWRDEVEEHRREQAWLTAKPLEPMAAAYDLPACPRAYAVAASDGSHIDVDRHGIADYWVVNVGTVALTYGPDASFRAETRPTLGFQEGDLTLRDSRSGREYAVAGSVLTAHRDLSEGLGLVDMAMTLPHELPRVALQDGTMIRWTLNSFEPWVKDRFLQEQLTYLDNFSELSCPVASYLSRPRSAEVTGLVQFLHVRGEVGQWKMRYPQRSESPFRGVIDHLLMSEMLRDGQRGARFQSMSRINVEDYPDQHKIQFFYLKVGREIARVEFPAWVAEGDLDLLHAVVYDQCRRGMDYPVALQRAHEQAVIHEGDRRQLQALVERSLVAEDVALSRSMKSVSKLRPGL